MVLFVPICKPYGSPLSGNIGIFRLIDRFQTRLHFQRAEFDLEPLMFNEALAYDKSGVCVEIYMGSSIKDFFLREQRNHK
jgi:hypothetical protein